MTAAGWDLSPVAAVLLAAGVFFCARSLWREHRADRARRVDDWLTYTRTPRQ